MDSILSTVLSVFSHNPIIVLGIIAYVAFSIIRGKNTEESDEYESYERTSAVQPLYACTPFVHCTKRQNTCD